jgi:hypothetical protein
VAAHSQILTEIESQAGFAAGHQFPTASNRLQDGTLESDQEWRNPTRSTARAQSTCSPNLTDAIAPCHAKVCKQRCAGRRDVIRETEDVVVNQRVALLELNAMACGAIQSVGSKPSTSVDYKTGCYATLAPLAARGKILVGYSGGEFGVRGSVSALDAESGKRIWRTYTELRKA